MAQNMYLETKKKNSECGQQQQLVLRHEVYKKDVGYMEVEFRQIENYMYKKMDKAEKNSLKVKSKQRQQHD